MTVGNDRLSWPRAGGLVLALFLFTATTPPAVAAEHASFSFTPPSTCRTCGYTPCRCVPVGIAGGSIEESNLVATSFVGVVNAMFVLGGESNHHVAAAGVVFGAANLLLAVSDNARFRSANVVLGAASIALAVMNVAMPDGAGRAVPVSTDHGPETPRAIRFALSF